MAKSDEDSGESFTETYKPRKRKSIKIKPIKFKSEELSEFEKNIAKNRKANLACIESLKLEELKDEVKECFGIKTEAQKRKPTPRKKTEVKKIRSRKSKRSTRNRLNLNEDAVFNRINKALNEEYEVVTKRRLVTGGRNFRKIYGQGSFSYRETNSSDDEEEPFYEEEDIPEETIESESSKSSDEEKEVTNRGPGKRPKGYRSAYIIFLSDFRKENAGKYTFGKMGKEGGKKWKSLSEQEKEVYLEKEKILNSNLKENNDKDTADETNPENTPKEKPVKKEKVKKPGPGLRPKGYRSAFVLFMDDFRKENAGKYTFGTMSCEGGKKWKRLSKEEKQHYYDIEKVFNKKEETEEKAESCQDKASLETTEPENAKTNQDL